ncbi:MAG TPA: serine hydrolase domain-containing protein, partial [Magnetospirillaceae bacterium]|nr:serine hydrolase domain-containing protein [Magnetospirillaceae bacterium]
MCVLLPGLAFAAGAGQARLDRIAGLYAEKENFSGSVLVARHGKVLLEKAYGKATADTRYPIGCITLQFTAAALLVLQQDGKLHLDDPLTAYLPEA